MSLDMGIMIRPAWVLVLLLVSGALQVPDWDADDILTCLHLFDYHSSRLLAARPLSNPHFRQLAFNYVDICKSQLSLSDYTKVVTYVGGVPTPLFPQEQYLSLKLH